MKKFYITTTLPYVNSSPHMGFALEIIQADIIARFKRQKGYDVFFNTGTDEHGTKIYKKALEENKSPQEYVDEMALKFEQLKDLLNLSYTKFIRTTDQKHINSAQEFWKRCEKKGDIYKGLYKIKYCVGCELEKTESDLVSGKCPIHPNLKIENIEEENYFFKFSSYQKKLLNLYNKYPDFVLPNSKFNEIKNFVKGGLRDFSISRLKEKMPWGIPVPGDEKHVMYVWFDALINYISTLNWPEDQKKFKEFWGTKEKPKAIQIAGKDNLRQQSAMWQAMLMSANLPTSRQILIHGFITSGGMKMSKSLGNVINPSDAVKKYGADALRFYLAKETSPFEDSDFSIEKFEARYRGDLANGLGNFASRILSLSSNLNWRAKNIKTQRGVENFIRSKRKKVDEKMEKFKFNEALGLIWEIISFGDEYINAQKPWSIEETNKKENVIYNLVIILKNVAELIYPFMPATSEKISKAIKVQGKKIKTEKTEILFPKIN